MTGRGNSISASAFIGVLALTLVPLPAWALDILLAISVTLALVTFMVTLYVDRPLDFSSFPSLLLLVTLLRLALNIATTRRILLHGDEGVDAAGGMVRAFGEFAVGGNFVVGAVVFLILVVVNFIVITKGAERISEVGARFTLDSMPGKQMAIDADLGAGFIDEKTARERRKSVEREADFYGTMDGASKFVRGDAVAGLIITAINLLAGLVVGTLQHGMALEEAARTFTILTIGDGLVTQIPALVTSTGAALLTTRGSTPGDFGGALGNQLFSRSRPLLIAAAVVLVLSFLPGMPLLALWMLAGGLFWLSRRPEKAPPSEAPAGSDKKAEGKKDPQDPDQQKTEIQQLLPVDLLSLTLSLDLLPLVDASRGGEVLTRIASLRKQLALDLGIMLPPVHVEDDLRMPAGTYRVKIRGAKVAEGRVKVGQVLAIDPTGEASKGIRGELVKEPTFGLPAKWIGASERARAEAAGCTVVDPSAVIATHLSQMVRGHAGELLGRAQAQEIIDVAARQDPKLVEDLIPHLLPLAEVIKVLRNLLREGVSIRDARTILEVMSEHAAQTKDPAELTELVRQRLGRQITQNFTTDTGDFRAMILDPLVENVFRPGRGPADPKALSKATSAIEQAAQKLSQRDEQPVLVVAPDVRRAIAEIALRHVPGLSVLSYREIDPGTPFVTRTIVSFQEAAS